VLGIYAELDSRVNGSRDAAAAALEAAGLVHELRTFDGVDHAFFNDADRATTPTSPPPPPSRRSTGSTATSPERGRIRLHSQHLGEQRPTGSLMS